MKKKLILFFCLIFFLIFAFFLFILFIYPSIPASSSQSQVIFEIKKGEDPLKISKNLKNQGLIDNEYLFLAFLFFSGKIKELKAGQYYLSPSMPPSKIIQILSKGKTIQIKITIPEGWNLQEIANYLDEKNLCQKEEFLKIVGWQKNPSIDFSEKFDFLKDKPKNVSLEGYLFPDTYFVKKNSSCLEIVEMFLKNFDRKLTPNLREEIFSQKKTIFEIVTMASILEKEVKTKEDKEIVSGILWKRIKSGIPLQADATITYITGKKTTKISYDELKIDSPYNTYKYLGLPLGPISNPGMESILAAIYPKESDFWYYLTTPEGKTIFSKSFYEHSINQAKYLK